MPVAVRNFVSGSSSVAALIFPAAPHRLVARAARLLLAASVFVAGSLAAQQGTSVSDANGPKIIVPSTLTTQVFVLNGDASISGFSTVNSSTYAMHCNAPNGLATSGAASLTFTTDDRNNAVFQTGAGSSGPATVGRGVPYSGSNCFDNPALAVGANSASAVLSAEDISHKYLFVVANGTSGNADTITSYYTASVGFIAIQQTGQAKLDTGGVYTSAVVDQDGNYGDAIVTEMRTPTSPGGTWLYNNAYGTATKLLGPGGVPLPAVNSFIIHNPTDGGGGLLVLVNQDGLTAANLTNPPLDATPFTIIDLGQLHDLVVAKNNPKTLTLPTVTTISSALGYYAMLGAVFNPVDHKIYAVVGGGTSTASIQRLIVRYDPYSPTAPAETVVNDVSAAPLNGSQTTQLALNAANGTLEMLATDSNRVFTAGIGGAGPAASELLGSTFSDTNFTPTFIASNSLFGETYIASTAQVDIVTKNPANLMQAELDMTGNEVLASVGSASVVLLGKFPDPYEPGISTTNITITATPQAGGPSFTFATLIASSSTTLPRYVSGTFPSAGIYSLVASFPGDSAYAPATSAPVVIAVGQALFTTTTTATASFNSTTGAGSASVTLSGANYVPTGTIKVTSVNSGLTLATLFLSGGINNPISIAFTAPPSTTAITVAYSGDQKNQASATGNVTLTQVAQVTPVITVTGPATGTVGNPASFTVSLTSTTTTAPTGNIGVYATSPSQSFVNLATVSAASAFAAGGVGFTWTPTVADNYSIYVLYGGDGNYNAVTSLQVGSIVVAGGTYTFTLGSPTTAVAGASFNVAVNASTGAAATGSITISAVKFGTSTQIALGTVSASTAANGGATLAASIANSGVYTLSGTYAGDTNYPASTSANTPIINVTGGTTGAVTISPATATLTAAVGSTGANKNFVLYNTGNAALTISSIAATGQGFSQFNGCPSSTLQSGTNCTINVNFAPLAVGTVNGTLSITDNATGSPHTAALIGIGVAGAAVASPASVSFIDQTVGTGSFLRPQVTLSNSGTAAFTISSVTLSTTPDFELTTNNCAAGSLTPGASCTVSVEFHPTTVGTKTATLTFNTSNSTVPQTVMLTAKGLSGNPAILPNCIDSDGDGLCDDWETNGVWVRTSSTSEKFVDLPSMGADPRHKDIFIQADYMATSYVPTGDHTHKLNLASLAKDIKAFEISPVNNPDGKTGIHLHIDCGYDCTMDPIKNTLWGNASLANEIPEVEPFDPVDAASSKIFSWSNFDTASTTFNASGRNLIFHHLILSHDIWAGNSTSGISRNAAPAAQFITGASDFIVSLGSWTTDMMGTALQQAGTLMHELGHNLGLQHGGNDGFNYKPSYLSVMNYNIQTNGLVVNNQNGYIDYSRFTLPTLDENKLNEQVGLNVTAAAYPATNGYPSADHYGLYFFCSGDDPTQVAPQLINSFTGNVNWNCSTSKSTVGGKVTLIPYIDPTLVRSDINADGFKDVLINGIVTGLTSFNDWPALVYTGGSVGGNGVGVAPLTATTSAEITQEQASLNTPLFGVAVSGMGRVRTAPNSQMTLQFVVKNIGLTDDIYTLTTAMQNGWAINTPAPSTLAIPAGGQTQVSVTYTVPSNAANGSFDKLFLTAVSQTAPQILDSMQVETYAVSTPFPDSVSTTAVFFGSQNVATTGGAQSVVILNTGSSTLSFGTVTTTAEFAQTNTCGTSLAVGASCVVNITFTPSASGTRTGTLTINDGTGTAKTVALNGTGVTPPLPIPAVTLTATPTSTSTGQTVTLSINVATLTSTAPTGTATITDGTTQYGQVTLDATGNGTFTSTTLSAGTYSLYAVYSGDTTYRASNSSYTPFTIATATPTTLALTTSAAAVATGTTVTFTATLGGGSGTSQPTGTVRFFDATTQIGTGTLNASGVATFATSTLAAGAHSITATYAGDNVFGNSASTIVAETVGIFATTNKLTASATTVVTGTSVTLTATLTATTGTPTGTVTFLDGTATLGTGTLNANGVATLSTSTLAIGTHSITSVYAATGNFGASTSTAVQVIVTAVPDFSIAANPTSLTVTSGTSGTAVFTVTPINGYAGTLSLACGTLPTYASCSFAPAKLTFTSTTQTAQTSTLTFSTTQAVGMLQPALPGRSPLAPISLALGLLAFGLGRKGRRLRKLLSVVLVFAASASLIALSGCFGSSAPPATAAGTYTVPITITDGTTSHSISYSVTVK